MKVHRYETSGGKDLILAYINKLSKKEQVDAFSVMEKMESGNFDGLTIKPWRGKIAEVYFYKHNRIFYIIADSDNIYLLHACRKQKNRTEEQDNEKVEKRAKELGNVLCKKFI